MTQFFLLLLSVMGIIAVFENSFYKICLLQAVLHTDIPPQQEGSQLLDFEVWEILSSEISRREETTFPTSPSGVPSINILDQAIRAVDMATIGTLSLSDTKHILHLTGWNQYSSKKWDFEIGETPTFLWKRENSMKQPSHDMMSLDSTEACRGWFNPDWPELRFVTPAFDCTSFPAPAPI